MDWRGVNWVEWIKALTSLGVALSAGFWTYLQYQESARDEVREAVTLVNQSLAAVRTTCAGTTRPDPANARCYENFIALQANLQSAKSVLRDRHAADGARWTAMWDDVDQAIADALDFRLEYGELQAEWDSIVATVE